MIDSKLGVNNVDTIVGFEINIDEIQLSATQGTVPFSGLALGDLSAGAFHIGPAAADASDRIIYDSASGNLYFDHDGLGGDAQIRFAKLAIGLALDNLDFVVI